MTADPRTETLNEAWQTIRFGRVLLTEGKSTEWQKGMADAEQMVHALISDSAD